MTPSEYRAALQTLGLSIRGAGRWLGVTYKTAQNYADRGPSPPAARAITMALLYGVPAEQEKPTIVSPRPVSRRSP